MTYCVNYTTKYCTTSSTAIPKLEIIFPGLVRRSLILCGLKITSVYKNIMITQIGLKLDYLFIIRVTKWLCPIYDCSVQWYYLGNHCMFYDQRLILIHVFCQIMIPLRMTVIEIPSYNNAIYQLLYVLPLYECTTAEFMTQVIICAEILECNKSYSCKIKTIYTNILQIKIKCKLNCPFFQTSYH